MHLCRRFSLSLLISLGLLGQAGSLFPAEPAGLQASADPAPASAPTPAPDGKPLAIKYKGLVYAIVEGQELKLDLILPPAEETPPAAPKLPVLVWIHGGGWREGNRGFTPLSSLAHDGYAVATIDYRFVQKAVFPAQIQDCKAAVRWLRAHATEYNLDPDRIAAAGESAGGQLAALLGTSGGVPELEGAEGNPDFSSRVQAVLDLCGPADFLAPDTDTPQVASLMSSGNQKDMAAARQILGRQIIMSGLFGGPVAEHQEMARLASPIAHITQDDPPFFIVHGNRDFLVPYAQSVALQEKLAAAGIEAELETVEGAGHGFGKLKPAIMAKVQAFFEKNLKNRAPVAH